MTEPLSWRSVGRLEGLPLETVPRSIIVGLALGASERHGGVWGGTGSWHVNILFPND